MPWSVVKQISFSYGHRLMDYDGACKHPHGHNGLVEVECSSDALDRRSMVIDFGDVKEAVKRFIDENWDHAMLLRKDDPLVQVYRERGEPVYLFDENPTAETFARHVFRFAKDRGLPVTEVRFWETPTSYAAYRE